MTPTYTTDDINDILEASQTARRSSGWGRGGVVPAWGQLILAVLAVVVSVVLAWSNLDKRMSLLEQKMDYVVRQVGPNGGR